MNTEASDRVAPRFDRKKVCLYEWLFDFMFSLIDYPLTPLQWVHTVKRGRGLFKKSFV